MGVKVTRIATAGQELAGGGTLDATYSGTDVDVTTGLPLDGLLDVNAPTPADQDVLTWDNAAGEWIAAPGGGGAPTTADYLVGTASGGLSAEIVVGTTPGGELGGTWASPTVDATHSGSAHLALGSTSSTAAAGDHTHAASGTGEILILDTPAGSPLVFADLIQNEAGTDLLYQG